MTKICNDCRIEKPLTEFGKVSNAKDGRNWYCKSCWSLRNKESRERHGGARRYHLRRRYGVEPEEVVTMIEEQGGRCAICRARSPEHVDHDHQTGVVRGVLCYTCNAGLGSFHDSVEELRRAIEYLEQNGVHSKCGSHFPSGYLEFVKPPSKKPRDRPRIPRPLCKVCGEPCPRLSAVFCSRTCMGISSRGVPTGKRKDRKTCEICGKTCKRPAARFCSYVCSGLGRRRGDYSNG